MRHPYSINGRLVNTHGSVTNDKFGRIRQKAITAPMFHAVRFEENNSDILYVKAIVKNDVII